MNKLAKPVALFGATGFVGQNVVRQLLSDGFMVRAIARRKFTETHPNLSTTQLDMIRATVSEVADAISGCDAIVNLIGIKQEQGEQTFHTMHVKVSQMLIEAARIAGIQRLIHISVVVSRPDAKSKYHDTKWQAECIVASSGLEITILKPGVIYGKGDDMLSHLTKMIRAIGLFPIVGNGSSLLQPVAVEDIALAVSRALKTPESIGKSYDIVGPDALQLREIVLRVSKALNLNTTIINTPISLMRIAVYITNLLMKNPLSTPAQLRMLVDGMTGNSMPMEHELGIHPKQFTINSISEITQTCKQRLPFDLRLGMKWNERPTHSPMKIFVLMALAFAILTCVFSINVSDIWTRLIAAVILLGIAGIATVRSDLRSMIKFDSFSITVGIISAVALYGIAWLFTAIKPIASQAHQMYMWKSGHSLSFMLPTITLAVIGEEIFWRGAVTRLIAEHQSKFMAILIGSSIYSIAHIASGIWLLPLAAFGMGLIWNLLFISTRNLLASFISHLFWDILVLVVAPLVSFNA